MFYLIEAGSVIERALSGMYCRELYWKDIVLFGFVIARRSEGTPGVCARTDNLLSLQVGYILHHF